MKIAILTPLKFEESETFIQNHITGLPFESVVIYGGSFPHLAANHIPTTFEIGKHKVWNLLKKKLGFKTQSFQEYHLKKILVKEKIELVFAEYLITGAETVGVCEKLQIPLVAIALGYEISRYAIIKRYKQKYQKLFQYAKNIIVVSEHMRKNIETLDCPKDKIVYSPAGPSDDFFKLKPTFNSKQILAVGRFVDKKAPHLTILAFQKVLNKIPEAQLVMAGDGMLLNACKDLAKTLNIENNVSFIGKINRGEHQELLESSYMFVQHSKIAESGDSEGTPVAILEGSAAGLPIVSTIHAGIPNVVIDAKTGFLVPENDINLMAEKMVFLLENIETAKKMGKQGKEYIKKNFTLKKHIKKIANHIKS